MTVDELKSLSKLKNLPVSGVKADLVNRLSNVIVTKDEYENCLSNIK